MIRGVLVAGGQGQRLGVPKSRVTVGGRTLLERALDTLRAVASEVVIAAPETMDLRWPRQRPQERRVFDRPPGGGPLAGVVAALEDGDFRVAVVLGIDFPFMEAALLTSMVARLEEMPSLRAIVPAPGGRLQPLAAVYGRDFASELDAAYERGERSIVRAVERIGPTVLRDEALRELPGGDEAFFNLNTPDDLIEAARRIAARAAHP